MATGYAPPLNDIRFVLDHVVDLAGLSQLPDLEHADPATVHGLLEEYGRFVAEVFAPLDRPGDQQGSRFDPATGSVTTPDGWPDAYRRYVDGGWGSVPFEPEHGGGGFPWLVAVAMQELLTSASMSFSLCPLLTQGAIDMLTEWGGEEHELYLQKMISGEWAGTMNLTEPEAGSDVGALRTKAIPADDGTWRITGQKIFITYGEHDLTDNIVHLVLARTPDAGPGTKGISCFIVPKFVVGADGALGERNDVKCVSIEHKLGIHASPTCVMVYGDDGDGAVGYLIGEANAGMRYMFTMMNNARLSVGLQGLSVAERAYQAALAQAQERRQGRRPGQKANETVAIIEHPDVRRMLLTQRSSIEAMRALLYLNAWAIDVGRHHADPAERERHQELADLLTPVSKAWSTDLGNELTSLALQVHGGMGYVEETGVAQHYPRHPHRRDLRRHQRHPGHRPGRPQAPDAQRRGRTRAHRPDAERGAGGRRRAGVGAGRAGRRGRRTRRGNVVHARSRAPRRRRLRWPGPRRTCACSARLPVGGCWPGRRPRRRGCSRRAAMGTTPTSSGPRWRRPGSTASSYCPRPAACWAR